MAREKHSARTQYGADWNLWSADGRNQWAQGEIEIILLQEIRDELKALNATLRCPNFLAIPRELRTINRRLAKQPAMRMGQGRPRKATE